MALYRSVVRGRIGGGFAAEAPADEAEGAAATAAASVTAVRAHANLHPSSLAGGRGRATAATIAPTPKDLPLVFADGGDRAVSARDRAPADRTSPPAHLRGAVQGARRREPGRRPPVRLGVRRRRWRAFHGNESGRGPGPQSVPRWQDEHHRGRRGALHDRPHDR